MQKMNSVARHGAGDPAVESDYTSAAFVAHMHCRQSFATAAMDLPVASAVARLSARFRIPNIACEMRHEMTVLIGIGIPLAVLVAVWWCARLALKHLTARDKATRERMAWAIAAVVASLIAVYLWLLLTMPVMPS